MIPIMYNSCGMPELAMSTKRSASKGDITEMDVLCGRDKITHSHVGNKRFLGLIKRHRDTYQNATSREVKTRISCDIVQMIRVGGGRFLKCNDRTGEYEDQDDIVAREKVAHALRSCKADSSRSNNSNNNNSKSIKRTRVVKKHEPTERENALFAQALQYQRQIFQQLLSQTDSTSGIDEDSHSDDSSSSASKSSGESSSQSSSEDDCDELNATTTTQPLETLESFELDLDTLEFLEDL
jgi:hypothetical protein